MTKSNRFGYYDAHECLRAWVDNRRPLDSCVPSRIMNPLSVDPNTPYARRVQEWVDHLDTLEDLDDAPQD